MSIEVFYRKMHVKDFFGSLFLGCTVLSDYMIDLDVEMEKK